MSGESKLPQALESVISQQQNALHENIRVFALLKSRVDSLFALQSANSESRPKCDFSSSTTSNNESSEEFPFISTFVVFVGCTSLFTLALKEWKSFNSKLAKSDDVQTSKDYWKLFAEFLQYRLDFYLSVSPMSKPLFLLILSFVIILQSSIAMVVLTDEDFGSAFWKAWTFGKIIGFFTSIAGMIIFAMMIGVITESIGDQLEEFKKGKSPTTECDHTVILGWSEKGMVILQQLALANQSAGGKPIVILCDRSKEEMEEMLSTAVSKKKDPLLLYGSEVVFRRGNPLAEVDLVKVSAERARSIIVLAPDHLEPDAADARMVRQVLSLQQIRQASGGALRGFAVVEVQDIDNRALVQIAGKGDVEVIATRDMVGRLMLLASRSPLIAVVLDELIGFEGCEFYLREWPQLVGRTFGSIRFAFDAAVPVGIKTAAAGDVRLNPPDETVLGPGDLLIVLAEDDNSYAPSAAPREEYEGFFQAGELPDRDEELDSIPEKMLFCGWRRDMADLIRELDDDVPPGSELWLFNEVPIEDRATKLLDKGNKLQLHLQNLTMRHVVGNPLMRRELASLAEASDGRGDDGLEAGRRTGRREVLNFFSSVSILSDYGESERADEAELDAERADNRCIATTLMIRDLQMQCVRRMERLGLPCDFAPTISEIVEPATRGLMEFSTDLSHQGFIMSSTLVACTLAMVSENRDMNRIVGELLSSQGNQIRIRRARELVDVAKGDPLSFWDVSCLAGMSREILIGYIPAHSIETGHGAGEEGDPLGAASWEQAVTMGARGDGWAGSTSHQRIEIRLNPPGKSEPRVWAAQDRLILVGLCRQAKRQRERTARRLAWEAALAGELAAAAAAADRGSAAAVPIHGRLHRLDPGRENEMEEDSNWRDRLCFVRGGALCLVTEDGYERVCRLDEIQGIQAGNGWPPGRHTLRLDLRGEGRLPAIFDAPSRDESDRWIEVLSDLVGAAAAAAAAEDGAPVSDA